MASHSRRHFLSTSGKAAAAVAGTVGAYTLSSSAASAWPAPDKPTGASAPKGHKWTEYFVDHFQTMDTSTWYRYHSTYGDALQTEDYLRPQNVKIDNGTLKIITKRENYGGRDFTSGFISTSKRGKHASQAPKQNRFFPRAGFYEFKGKVHHGQGIHHGCWLRHLKGAGTAEIDVMESFHSTEPGKTRQTVHLDGDVNTYMCKHHIENPYAQPDWHTWGVAIIPVGLDVEFQFYTDGVRTGTHRAKRPKFWHEYPNKNLWDLAINTHTSGAWVGHPDDDPGWSRYNGGFCLSNGKKAAPSDKDDCSRPYQRSPRLPATFQLDYVKVWRLDASAASLIN